MAVGDFKIGTSVVGLTNIEGLTTSLPVPRVTRPTYELVKLGDGSLREIGFPFCSWTFPQLTIAQVEQLRTFCTGSSVSIYIRTLLKVSATSYANYLATMIWPDDEDSRGGYVFNLIIKFESMVVQA